ncbi:MAG TPA: cystathionine beta-lyase [Hyphomicrobiaceae bacterium]|nr:cystathionine beta-lyase [Hyphomicrobiaceae bacterium]
MTHRDKTRLVHVSRTRPVEGTGPVNPPIVRTSTVLYKDMATLRSMAVRRSRGERLFTYGIRGTPTTFALEDALTEIERGSRTMLFPSGLAAIAHVFLSVLKPGDHALLAETIYGPARSIADRYLAERGIECEFYAGGHEEVGRRLRPATRLVYLDNPGSIVFDVQDLPAIAKTVAGHDILIAVDNTWGAPGLYRPLALGADISIIAITKYIAGHSDLAMGSVTANDRCADRLWADANLFCESVSPDEAYLALRGLRTAAARMTMQQAHAVEVIRWLERHPLIDRILYPALETHPGHAIWKRDFSGANSLFSLVFRPGITQEQANYFVDRLELFGIGASWGGFESLALTYPQGVYGWSGGTLVRLHIGLEDPADLIADIEQALNSLCL